MAKYQNKSSRSSYKIEPHAGLSGNFMYTYSNMNRENPSIKVIKGAIN